MKELAASKTAFLGGQGVNELDNFTAAKFLAQRHFDAFGLSTEIRELEIEVRRYKLLKRIRFMTFKKCNVETLQPHRQA